MRKLLCLLLVGMAFAQGPGLAGPAADMFGDGPPNSASAQIIGTRWVNITTNQVYVCTNLTYSNKVYSCTWTMVGPGTAANCAAAGTAANPSVVACTAAASGAFSCATNASTGTCTVNSTAVTANSRIFIMPSAAEGTNLGVTCNTTADTGLTAPRLASKSAGSSFTINLGTFSTNPECFNFLVIN